ncbi:MAG TPA: heparan-alpha-glucosaminide N-acetyltransferase domain-containing protein [Verrucomicrobiae bacterium]|nr:heparan-alpha-glucosaminide N-acetyltransferase domain-containing protein [Verrucomicrobiae bacterium]
MPESSQQRVAYIDWMRGLACALMFQTHCYDSWLGAPAKKTTFFGWSQLGGTLPAPLFLFLAGVSFSLVTGKMRKKGVADNLIAAKTIRRGADIFGMGLLFRVQEFLLGWGWSPWTDLLRVDILNTIGASMMLMGAVCRVARTRKASLWTGVGVAAGIGVLTPLLWTKWAPKWLPWYLESYVNGVHNLGTPQHWLFPLFPWAAFAFAGLAAGFFLFGDWATRHELLALVSLGGAGVALILFSAWLDANPYHLYSAYDYWHSSPEFLFLRVGVLLLIMLGSYAWCRWGAGQWGFSPLIQLGQTSLLVYWVHIEFVYGRFSILTKGAQSVPWATAGLATIFCAMLLLSLARTHWKGRGAEFSALWRKPSQHAHEI